MTLHVYRYQFQGVPQARLLETVTPGLTVVGFVPAGYCDVQADDTEKVALDAEMLNRYGYVYSSTDPVGGALQYGQLSEGAAATFPTGTASKVDFANALGAAANAATDSITVVGDGVKKFRISVSVNVSMAGVLGGTNGTVQVFDNGVAIATAQRQIGLSGISLSVDNAEVTFFKTFVLGVGSHVLDVRVLRTSAGGSLASIVDRRTFEVLELVGT